MTYKVGDYFVHPNSTYIWQLVAEDLCSQHSFFKKKDFTKVRLLCALPKDRKDRDAQRVGYHFGKDDSFILVKDTNKITEAEIIPFTNEKFTKINLKITVKVNP